MNQKTEFFESFSFESNEFQIEIYRIFRTFFAFWNQSNHKFSNGIKWISNESQFDSTSNCSLTYLRHILLGIVSCIKPGYHFQATSLGQRNGICDEENWKKQGHLSKINNFINKSSRITQDNCSQPWLCTFQQILQIFWHRFLEQRT